MRRSATLLALVGMGLGFAACLGRAALEPVGPPEQGDGGAAGAAGGTAGTAGTGTGTTSTTSTSTITTTTTSTTTSIPCDGTGDCDTCAECALLGPCYDVYAACASNDACAAFADCFDSCAEPDPWICMEQCGASNPEGYELFYGLLDCLACQQCPGDCWELASVFCYWEQ